MKSLINEIKKIVEDMFKDSEFLILEESTYTTMDELGNLKEKGVRYTIEVLNDFAKRCRFSIKIADNNLQFSDNQLDEGIEATFDDLKITYLTNKDIYWKASKMILIN